MSRKKIMTIVSFACVAAIISIGLPLAMAKAQTDHANHSQMNMMDMNKNAGQQAKAETISLEKIHSENLPMLLQSIDKAIKAIENSRTSDAVAELQKAKTMITAIDKAVSQHITPKFVNNKCPIMGTPIDPDKVPADLIREYKGQKVAFCCAQCPAAWDKLSDAEKDAKLAKVKINSAENHAEHQM